MNAVPSVASAISSSASSLTGTGTSSLRPGTWMYPSGVPKAMVLTGTLALFASRAAIVSGRPTVVSPSDSSTMRAGTSSSTPSAGGGAWAMAWRLA